MANQETIADIVAEMREIADDPNCVAPTGLNHLADRIEAAAKRERAKIEADALEVGGIVGAAQAKRPVRNCDRFDNWADALCTYLDEHPKMHKQSQRAIDACCNLWLFAPAKKGETI